VSVLDHAALLGEARRNTTHRRSVVSGQLAPLSSGQVDELLHRNALHPNTSGSGRVVT